MKHPVSRRALLGSMLALTGSAALANAPMSSLRPTARAGIIAPPVPATRPKARPSLERIIADAGLAGQVGLVVADAATGALLEAVDPDTAKPPASVTKSVTALYAIEALGEEYRFHTTLYGTGPVEGGVLKGDLVLAGGGDPNLVTDDLKTLADRLADAGVTGVEGKFQVWAGALPGLDEIDESQLDFVGYNPAISGLNLNFNRVHFEWRKQGSSYAVALDARSETHRPDVTVARVEIANRSTPVFTYTDGGDVDIWTVARGALGGGGSRWLPVRNPALYAGEVFATFARGRGIALTPAERVTDLPSGQMLARHSSPVLREVLRDMLKYSTNLTAEVAGLTASARRAGEKRVLTLSAQDMTGWAGTRAPITARFADHSGLSDASRISARDMVHLLIAPGARNTLQPILKAIPLRDANDRVIANPPARVVAKTGTLNFVSALSGYVHRPDGPDLAFAIFAADLDARARGKASGDEQPNGSITFNTRAKSLQQTLLRRWGGALG